MAERRRKGNFSKTVMAQKGLFLILLDKFKASQKELFQNIAKRVFSFSNKRRKEKFSKFFSPQKGAKRAFLIFSKNFPKIPAVRRVDRRALARYHIIFILFRCLLCAADITRVHRQI